MVIRSSLGSCLGYSQSPQYGAHQIFLESHWVQYQDRLQYQERSSCINRSETYTHIYIYIYIYTYQQYISLSFFALSLSLYIYIYISLYTYTKQYHKSKTILMVDTGNFPVESLVRKTTCPTLVVVRIHVSDPTLAAIPRVLLRYQQ